MKVAARRVVVMGVLSYPRYAEQPTHGISHGPCALGYTRENSRRKVQNVVTDSCADLLGYLQFVESELQIHC
jgi:hypothetical protein